MGWRDEVFANTSGSGTLGLACRVFYPSTTIGAGTPLVPRLGGYPVLLHLHGIGGNAIATPEYSGALAEAGYILVMQGTATNSSSTQFSDGMATITALFAENTKVSSPYRGQLDMTRFAVLGHSMGGGNTFRILANSTVPKLGVTFAPTNSASYAGNVRTPMLILTGLGDEVINPNTSIVNFNALDSYIGSKVLYLFTAECTHATMIASPVTQTQAEIFLRSVRVAIGFLDAYLKGPSNAFDAVVGADPRADSHLAQISSGYEKPQAWFTWVGTVSFIARLEAASEPGIAYLMASLGEAAIPTPYGTFGLDLGTLVGVPLAVGTNRTVSVDLPLPTDLVLSHIPVFFQAVGPTRTGVPKLSTVGTVRID